MTVRQGSLTVVGTGYGGSGRITPETESVVRSADTVFYLLSDPLTAEWLKCSNPNTVSLHDSYREGRSGSESCDEMVERIIAPLADGESVCAAFYGHPSIFVSPASKAMRRARALGHAASMLPAVSALDCLYADLGVDPGVHGCQLFEATDFIVRNRTPDTATPLIILQAGAAGVTDYTEEVAADTRRVSLLVDALLRFYPSMHEVTAYETAPLPVIPTRIERMSLSSVPLARLTVYTTLYIPPSTTARTDPSALARLGLAEREGHIGKL